MLRKDLNLLVLGVLLVLTACQTSRPIAVTALTVQFRADSFTLSSQRIIAGAQITLTLANLTETDHHFIFLAEPLKKEIESLDPKGIVFQVPVPAGQTLEKTFTAPLAPGEYVLICALPGHLVKGESAKIVVIHPDYAR